MTASESNANYMSRLLLVREHLGPYYGSEDLSMLLYSIVRREQPTNVLELGTGLGVCTAWIAQALKENGTGTVTTIDNGLHYPGILLSGEMEKILHNNTVLAALLQQPKNYITFLTTLFDYCRVSQQINVVSHDLSTNPLFPNAHTIPFLAPPVDLLFSDFDHGPSAILAILRCFLPRMNSQSSIFIDSASTHIPSYFLLERLTSFLNEGRIPIELLDGLPPDERFILISKVRSSRFRLMHLFERRPRAQNSTAWLSIEPLSLAVPHNIVTH